MVHLVNATTLLSFIITLLSPMTIMAEEPHKAETAAPGKQLETWLEPLTGMKFIKIAGGCFQMGQSREEQRLLKREIKSDDFDKYYADELPQHKVCLDEFWMGIHEVTQSEWQKVMDFNPAVFQDSPDYPVDMVSWDDAQLFVDKLNEANNTSQFRLPSEAEWEYAARAGTTTARHWGDGEKDACAYANVMDQKGKERYGKQIGSSFDCHDGYVQTSPVGKYQPNAFGLHDMLGNVNEWVQDWYDEKYYAKSPRDNPLGPETGTQKVDRGGSWWYVPYRVRSAYRVSYDPDYRNNAVGFRLAVAGRGETM